MPTPAPLTFSQFVAAPAAEAYRAFTHATALRDWLCDAAQSDPREGGRVFLWWNDGYNVRGSFSKLKPGARINCRWDGHPDAGPTEVQITFKAKQGGTQVTVTQSGFGKGSAWRETRESLERAWPESLENLASVLETGIDLRIARRPRLGIFIDEFTAAIAKEIGVPVARGIRLSGTAEGSGARASGLEKNDVIVKLNNKPAVDFPSLGAALHGLKAGDAPPVTFYRGAQKMTVPLTLSSFPVLEVPTTGAELAEALRKLHADIDSGIAKLVRGLTEAQADTRLAEGEWSVKGLIAHFILMERDYQSWLADMLNDLPVNDSLEMRPNVTPRIEALVKRLGTVNAMLKELKLAEAETRDLLANLPANFVQNRKHLYRRVAQWALEVIPSHLSEEHADQFQRTIAHATTDSK